VVGRVLGCLGREGSLLSRGLFDRVCTINPQN